MRIATQGRTGCELEHWEELKQFAADGRVTLLIPVVVRLEFRKHRRNFVDDFDDEMRKFESGLKGLCEDKKGIWNEAGDLVAALLSKWADLRSEKIEACKSRFEQVNQWLLTKRSRLEFLPYDETIMAAVKRRMFWGGHPRQEKNSSRHRLEGDLSIIESLIAYFRKPPDPDEVLLFCTENIKDFAVTVGERLCLHQHFSFDLPTNEVFPDLVSLLTSVKENLPVSKPTEDEIKEAEAKAAAEDQVAREMALERIAILPSHPIPAWAASALTGSPANGAIFFNKDAAQWENSQQNAALAHLWQQEEDERKRRLEEHNRRVIEEYNRTIERNRRNNETLPPT